VSESRTIEGAASIDISFTSTFDPGHVAFGATDQELADEFGKELVRLVQEDLGLDNTEGIDNPAFNITANIRTLDGASAATPVHTITDL
jgi:hypothetical protein